MDEQIEKPMSQTTIAIKKIPLALFSPPPQYTEEKNRTGLGLVAEEGIIPSRE